MTSTFRKNNCGRPLLNVISEMSNELTSIILEYHRRRHVYYDESISAILSVETERGISD